MIYSYIKQQLEPFENNPKEYFQALNTMDAEIQLLRDRYNKVWTYCCGCKGYVKLAEAYEGTQDCSVGGFRGYQTSRPVLRCGICHSIWKFLD